MMPKYRELSLFNIGVSFHGHLGPFLVLGLKAGKLLEKKIGKDPLTSYVLIELPLKRPYTCFADGIQVTLGCTLGKLNISLIKGKSIKLFYRNKDRLIILSVRKKILDEILASLDDKNKMISKAKEIWNSSSEELFIFRIV